MASSAVQGIDASWLTSKIIPPQLQVVVTRDRLVGSLTAAVHAGQVCGVVAPGGSGKTTLVADWARQISMPVAWYRLDARDRDLCYFIRGIATAIEQVIPGIGSRVLRALDRGALASAALDHLLETVKGHQLALVIDDFHHLKDLSGALTLFERIFNKKPVTLAPILIARAMSPLVMQRFLPVVLSGCWFSVNDLRFQPIEAKKLLAAHALDSQSAVQIVEYSQGMAAAMLLVARARNNDKQPTATHPFLVPSIGRETDELFLEYAEQRILNELPEHLRIFVLETGILGPLTIPEADAILERNDSAERYSEALACGLFIETIAETYRYHDLFAEHLIRIYLQENLDRVRELHCKAADWWARHGDVPRALELLAKQEEWEVLAALLTQERHALWGQGLWDTILTYFELLPSSFRTAQLYSLAGYVYRQHSQLEKAMECVELGKAAAQTEEEWLHPEILGMGLLHLASRDEEVIPRAKKALTIALKVGNPALEARVHELYGMALMRQGSVGEGDTEMWSAIELHKAAQDIRRELDVFINLSSRLIETGHIVATDMYLMRAEKLAQDLDDRINLGHVWNARASLYILYGDLITARKEAEQAQFLARELGSRYLECLATTTLAEIAVDAGAPEASWLAQEAETLAKQLGERTLQNSALRSLISATLSKQDPSRARELLQTARTIATSARQHSLLDLLEGTLILRVGNPNEAQEQFTWLIPRLIEVHQKHYAARASLLLAEALVQTGAYDQIPEVLNRIPTMLRPGCTSFLRPTAKRARQLIEYRDRIEGLSLDALRMLHELAATLPKLSVVPRTAEVQNPPKKERHLKLVPLD